MEGCECPAAGISGAIWMLVTMRDIRLLLGSRGSREPDQGVLSSQLAGELFKFMDRFSHPDISPLSPAPC